MDITTVVGLIAGFTLIVMGILNTADPSAYVDMGSVLIVVGCTCAALLVSFPLADVNRLFRVIRYAFYLPGPYKRIVYPEQHPPNPTDPEGQDSIAIQEELKLGILMMTRAKTYALAFGSIASLVGFIAVLRHLVDASASSIARGVAVALLTLFYGAVIAYLICLPLQTKLARRLEALQG